MKKKSQPNSGRNIAVPSQKRRRVVAISIGATILVALAAAIAWHRSDARSLAYGSQRVDGGVVAITLDPQAFAGEARDAYRIARERPELLSKLHCYCHCDVRLGHRNLLDCFRDDHAASCGICMGEAKDAEQMERHGTSVQEIRDTLRARYEGSE
jgi:Protein of unknown function with PCYCGC motif